ncbi:protein tipE isoform X2 [Condylostylus longicornis]|uniref:protein tipE isoform X2 n=1 Tax=Condylostylus longicornis TaxID=2530218 RepID=UPI00244E115D|nr:protein tipE isoform X2 [Condylostylus longicornis]
MKSPTGSASISNSSPGGSPSITGSKVSLNSNRSKTHSIASENKSEIIETFAEKAKFYTSLCMGTTAIVSVFAFLFLIPFVVDPAISTIIADFDPIPVTCVVTDHIYAEGIRNCTWASCREGCTNAPIKCHQLLVNYTKIPFEKWQEQPQDLDLILWDVSNTKFLINSEGCGYPPSVNCSVFAKKYGYNHLGEPFPCFYSRAYPDLVIGRYSWNDNLTHLILSLIIPNVLFAISIGVLSYWYCPCCEKCNKSRLYEDKYPTKEEDSVKY